MIFRSPRLTGRRFGPRDLDDLVAMRRDPEVERYQNWSDFTREDGIRCLEEQSQLNPGDPGWYQIALEETATGHFIGDCGLRIVESEHRLAQIGYTIVRSCWNRGFATEAIIALTGYAFSSFPIHRITASVDPRNIGSCRALEKAGYVKEAHFRQSEWFKGEWADDVVYARLRSDNHHC
jgi:RimJ/RimL family protein N-acetyltransferase